MGRPLCRFDAVGREGTRDVEHGISTRIRVRALVGAAAVLGWLLAPCTAAGSADEDQVKAAFLFRFAQFVSWPDDAFESKTAPLRIATLGPSHFADALREVVDGKVIGGHPIAVTPVSSLVEARRSHLLYIDSSQRVSQSELEALSRSGVFTVGSETGFANDGGLANFYTLEGKVRFEINERAARDAGLQVSSRLLRLARVVE